MARTSLTKRIEFCASHRYHNEKWDAKTNREVFGPCNNEHGHNYLLELTLQGQVDSSTGMVVNLYDLKQILTELLEEFDHKNLNLDTPYFLTAIPTTENLAHVFWELVSQRPDIGKLLAKIRLYEDKDLFAEIFTNHHDVGSLRPAQHTATFLTRGYHFTAGHHLKIHHFSDSENRRIFGRCFSHSGHGHSYDLKITIRGPIDHPTGQITNIALLDHIVHEHVIKRFDYQDLSKDPAFSQCTPTPGNLARTIWNLLASQISQGTLASVRISEAHGLQVEYRG